MGSGRRGLARPGCEAGCLPGRGRGGGAWFCAHAWAWPDPVARLVRDLSLAEHLDEYKEVGTFEFLEELAKSKEFGGPSPSH